MQIGRKLKKEIRGIVNSGKEIPDEVLQEIKGKNPDLSDEEILEYITREFPKVSEEDKQFKELEKEINELMKDALSYRGEPLEIVDLKDKNFDEDSVNLQRGKSEVIINSISKIEDYVNKSSSSNIKENLENLVLRINSLIERRGKTYSRKDVEKRLYINWAKQIGDLPLGNWSNRKAIYDYWKKIEEKEKKKLDKAFKVLWQAYYDDKKLGDEIKHAKKGDEYYSLQQLFSGGKEGRGAIYTDPPSYIIKINEIKMKVPDEFVTALRILEHYDRVRGILPPEGLDEETSEDSPTARVTEEERTTGPDYRRGTIEGEYTFDPKWLKKQKEKTPEEHADKVVGGGDPRDKRAKQVVTFEDMDFNENITRLDVDPIFYYRYHRDYEEIRIPKGQIDKVVKVIKDSPLRHAKLAPEELSEFDKWFDNFAEEAGRDEQYGGKFYLPVSNWIVTSTDIFDDLPDNPTNMDDSVTRFIEDVGEFLEGEQTQWATKQKKTPLDAAVDPKSSTKEEQRELLYRLRRASQPWDFTGRRGTDKKMAGFAKPWKDFIDAMNNYYVVPISGKFFFSPKELPRWAHSHTSYIIAIKNSKNNPIGYLLDKTIDGSLDEIVSESELKSLTTFISEVKRAGAKGWSKKYFNYGRKAAQALDLLFGDKFKEKNKQSIGYIIYDIAKKSRYNDDQIVKMAKKFPFWKDIKTHYDNYNQSQLYPIDQLRYALNTPQFTRFLTEGGEGISGANKKVYDELKRLDAIFDEFYKMDEINTAMLEAHDTIRKMNNEPIFAAHLSLDSIEDMDLIINKLHVEQKMEVTATEVDKIVKAVSSYESIAANFGINEESVYTIKALFR
tara:strand:+ start:2117 stop:4636 length:2520 start_codon:yes stop_codon:yes gene_type:complete